MSNIFNKFCFIHGIECHFTIPYNPSQNGVLEWKNQIPNAFWAKAIHTSCYLQNMFNSSSLDTITTHKVWTRIKPDINHLQNFGCVAFSHKPDEKR
jgi:hypothetical protein